MSFTLEQIWAAPDSAVYPILTSMDYPIEPDPIENRIKIARIYASPVYNLLNINQISLLGLPNFDVTVKTYGLTRALKMLSSSKITLEEIWATSDKEISDFLRQQRLPLGNNNRATLINFYL